MEASLYIHVPFCAGACDYCDFYSVPVARGDSRLGCFVNKLLADGDRLFEVYKPDLIPALYIGGGTPSVLGVAGIRGLLDGLSRLISRYAPPPVEITVEANPESADEAFLAAAREGGATRISLGAQSFHLPSRRAVNRVGAELSDETLRRRLAHVREYFPGAFSGDLMSGLPFQNERILLDDIAALLSCEPAHVSLYALTIDPETPLAASSLLPSPDEADRLWLRGRDVLEKSGYSQYEISNFCLAGKESRHNIRYWRMRNWLALGPSASGTIIDDESGTGFRYTVSPDIDVWLTEKAPGISSEKLDPLTLMKESFLMGFRYIEGPDADLFLQRFRRSIESCIPNTLSAWRERDLSRKDKAALTKDGLVFLDTFLLDAFQELDASYLPC